MMHRRLPYCPWTWTRTKTDDPPPTFQGQDSHWAISSFHRFFALRLQVSQTHTYKHTLSSPHVHPGPVPTCQQPQSAGPAPLRGGSDAPPRLCPPATRTVFSSSNALAQPFPGPWSPALKFCTSTTLPHSPCPQPNLPVVPRPPTTTTAGKASLTSEPRLGAFNTEAGKSSRDPCNYTRVGAMT